MGWFSNDSEQASSHQQWNESDPKQHEASFAHELIAGAASYEAAKAYEKHEQANGKPASHAEAKELMAGFAGAFIDREAETKGLDFIDREQAKRQARKHIDEAQGGW
ncbi:CipC1 protein [Penicillium verhagenii]|nr:CipC1 protein [Penicillium verhagenii]